MLWYVLQTRAGQEEKLAELISKMIPRGLYGEIGRASCRERV